MDGTPYISTDFNSVFPGSYASVSQGVHQCGGKRRRKQRKSNKQRRNNKQNKSQDGGTRSLEAFKELLYKSSEIIDLNFNDENKFILTSGVPIITFDNFKKAIGSSPDAEDASIREMFNDRSIHEKLEMCNSKFDKLTDP